MPEENYRTIIEQIARYKSSNLSVFTDFCRMAACCLAAGTREDEYFEAIKGYSKEELMQLSKALGLLIKEMESKPFTDVLGTYYTDVASHSSKQARGEFYTPPEISKLMARMTMNTKEIKSEGLPVSVYEPACGAGGMVLAIAEEFAPGSVDLLRITCQDVNPVAVDMCFINTSLWGIPARIIQGDTLAHLNSEKYCVNAWKNIHWARVGEDQRLAFLRIKDLAIEPERKSTKKPSFVDKISSKPPSIAGQVEFDFDLENSDTSIGVER